MKADAAFIADFAKSHIAVQAVAKMLRGHGIPVQVPTPELRPDAADRHAYRDGGDLLVTLRAEVKHRSIDFTGAHDYPYESVFVDESYKLSPERLASLLGYFILNRDLTHYAFVARGTADRWKTVRRWDRDQRRVATFKACPIELTSFHSIEK